MTREIIDDLIVSLFIVCPCVCLLYGPFSCKVFHSLIIRSHFRDDYIELKRIEALLYAWMLLNTPTHRFSACLFECIWAAKFAFVLMHIGLLERQLGEQNYRQNNSWKSTEIMSYSIIYVYCAYAQIPNKSLQYYNQIFIILIDTYLNAILPIQLIPYSQNEWKCWKFIHQYIFR